MGRRSNATNRLNYRQPQDYWTAFFADENDVDQVLSEQDFYRDLVKQAQDPESGISVSTRI